MPHATVRRFVGGCLMGTFFLPPFIQALIGYKIYKSGVEAEKRAKREAELQEQLLEERDNVDQ